MIAAKTIGDLGAVYLAFKAADLVFTYFVHRLGARVPRRHNGRDKFHHCLGVRHLECGNDVISAGRHIGTQQLATQFLRHRFCRLMAFLSTLLQIVTDAGQMDSVAARHARVNTPDFFIFKFLVAMSVH
jgi:hypothetical protein